MAEKNYFYGEQTKMMRSEINLSSYNPRKMSDEARKSLKRSIKKFGVVGGIVVNKQTGNTLVGGHQKIDILDELNKYPEKDYEVNVELVDIDEKTEKTLNIALNNQAMTGTWDYDKLRELIPDIDPKEAGLTDADLSFIGVDFIMQTEEENDLANSLDELMAGVNEDHQAEVQARKEEREAQKEAIKQAQEQAKAQQEAMDEEAERQAKIQHMKDVKKEVMEGAMQKAQDMDAYVMLSFTDFEAKKDFMLRFGYDPYMKFIKGEDFDSRCEVIIDE